MESADISKESIRRMVNGTLYSSGNDCNWAVGVDWQPPTHNTCSARDCVAFSPEGELHHFDTLAVAKEAIEGEEKPNTAALLYSNNATIDAKRQCYGWYVFCGSDQVPKFEDIKQCRPVRKTKVAAWEYGLEYRLGLNWINIRNIRSSWLLPMCNIAIFKIWLDWRQHNSK